MLEFTTRAKRYSSKIFMVLAWGYFSINAQLDDSDLFHILLEGNYVLDNHAIHRINDSNVVDEMQMIAQQYAYDVAVALAYRMAGIFGMYIFLSLLIGAVMFLVKKIYDYLGIRTGIDYLYVIITCLFMMQAFSIRPSIATICLLLMQILFTEHYLREGRKRWLIYILLTVIAEANIHMSYIPFHAVFLLPYIVPFRSNGMIKITSAAPKQEMELFITMLLTVPAGCINPYGLKGCIFFLLAEPWKLKEQGIGELQPWKLAEMPVWIITGLLIVFLFNIYKRKAVMSRTLFGSAGCILLAYMAEKNLWFLGFAVLWILTDQNNEHKNTVYKDHLGNILGTIINDYIFIIFAALLLTAQSILRFQSNISFLNSEGNSNSYYACRYLESHTGKGAKILTTSLGGRLEWEGYRVSYDQRPELLMQSINGNKNIFSLYYNAAHAKSYEELKKYAKEIEGIADFDYAVIESESFLMPVFMNSENWTLVYSGSESGAVVFKKGLINEH